MSATTHPLRVDGISRPAISVRATAISSFSLFMLAFFWAYGEGHRQLAFWILSGLMPIFTPASLALSVAATVHGIGSWGPVAVEFGAVGLGLMTILGSLRYLEDV